MSGELGSRDAVELIGDNEIKEYVDELHDESARDHVRVPRKNNLLRKFTELFAERVEGWHKLEDLRMRDLMFISYSVKDCKWREMMVTAIKAYFGPDPPLWYFEGNLEFNDSVEREIKQKRAITKVAILLTSNNYFASKQSGILSIHISKASEIYTT